MILRYAEFLWGLLLLIPLFITAFIRFRKNKTQLLLLGGEKRESFLFYSTIRLFLETLMMTGFVVMAMLALSAPNWTQRSREYNVEGRDISFVLDVSRSMTATDIYPSRLDAMIDLVSFLIDRMDNSRFSLVIFKGDAFTAVPLTSDKLVLKSFLELINPGIMSSPGSDMEKGLDEALRSFASDSLREKTIILISDGEKQTGNIISAARRCLEEEIPVITVAAGTGDGAILLNDDGTNYTGNDGFPVRSRVRTKDLQEVADLSAGAFFQLETISPGGDILQHLNEDFLFTLTKGIGFYRPDQYRFFLLPAVLFLFLFFLVRRFKWFSKK